MANARFGFLADYLDEPAGIDSHDRYIELGDHVAFLQINRDDPTYGVWSVTVLDKSHVIQRFTHHWQGIYTACFKAMRGEAFTPT